MEVNDLFSKIYCLNLERRVDRWLYTKSELERARFGIKVERFLATDWQKYYIGTELKCDSKFLANIAHLQSFINVLRTAKRDKLESFLLFEDDIVLEDNFKDSFIEYFSHLPGDWQMLYVSGNHSYGYAYTEHPNIVRCFRTYATHAVAFKQECYDTVIFNLEYHLDRIKRLKQPNPSEPTVSADVWLALLQEYIPTYSFTPSICWQREGYSDIEMKDTDSRHLLKY